MLIRLEIIIPLNFTKRESVLLSLLLNEIIERVFLQKFISAEMRDVQVKISKLLGTILIFLLENTSHELGTTVF